MALIYGGSMSGSSKPVKACYDEDTALYAHSVGDIIYVNDTLYKVTSAIVVGDAITDTGAGANITSNTGIPSDASVYVRNLPEGSGSGSGGGHKILNGSGTEMNQRSKLQFSGFTVSDDSTNGKTVITANNLKFGIDITYTDGAGEDIEVSDGVTTYTATLSEQGKAIIEVGAPGTYTVSFDGEDLGSVDVGLYKVKATSTVIYGFHLDGTKSDPAQTISYEVKYDGKNVANYSYTPVQMNLTTGVIDPGSWNLTDDFIIPRSCMLKYDGTVDYYLDENDETKKEDGVTPSDVANTSYGGNAMMEWGRDGQKIYMKIVPDATPTDGATYYISNKQVDSGFKDYSFYDCDGNPIDHFYTPKYCGSNVSSKLRSISGLAPINTQTGATEVTYATANNTKTGKTEWYTEVHADRQLINALLLLIGKSTNIQAVFGQGYTTGGSAASSLANSGTLNGKGQFCGYSTNNDKTKGVKVFGMEHWWGNIWRRTAGYVNISGTIKYKLTWSTVDGTTQTGYDATASGYKIVANATMGGTNGGYANIAVFDESGYYPKTMSGSETTYYCDGGWFNNGQSNYALVGGTCHNEARCGALCVHLDSAFSNSSWGIGASLSCKPLADAA